MASIWDKFESGLENVYEWIIPPRETGYFSKADSIRWDRSKLTPSINKNQGPLANSIQASALNAIGTETFRRDMGKDMTCATAACQILSDVYIPGPKDHKGQLSESIDFAIDAFDGRGEPGKLFKEHSQDFLPVGPGELARGDILILNIDQGGITRNPPGVERSPELYREYGYQKHMSIITDVYQEGIEVVIDRGRPFGIDEPKTSKFYTFEWLYGDKEQEGWFDKAYRYTPTVDNSAFRHLVYDSE